METAKVYIGELHYDAQDPDLYDTFEKYGSVEYVSIVKDHESGESRGYGFVQFSSESGAEKAIAAASGEKGVTIKGQQCTVELSRPKSRGGFRGGFRGGRGMDRDRGGRGGFRSSRGMYSRDSYGGGGRDRYSPPPRERYSRGGGRYGGRYSPPPRGIGSGRFEDRAPPPRFSRGSGRGYTGPRGLPRERDDSRERENYDRRDSGYGGRRRGSGGGGYDGDRSYGGGGYGGGGDRYDSHDIGGSYNSRDRDAGNYQGRGHVSPRGGYARRDSGPQSRDRYDSYRPRGGPSRY